MKRKNMIVSRSNEGLGKRTLLKQGAGRNHSCRILSTMKPPRRWTENGNQQGFGKACLVLTSAMDRTLPWHVLQGAEIQLGKRSDFVRQLKRGSR